MFRTVGGLRHCDELSDFSHCELAAGTTQVPLEDAEGECFSHTPLLSIQSLSQTVGVTACVSCK